MSSKFQQLPPEIDDEIAKHIPLGSLRACSLLDRSWTVRAQAILFRDISLYENFTSSESQKMLNFLHTIKTSPHLAKYVKTLRIEESHETMAMHKLFNEGYADFTNLRDMVWYLRINHKTIHHSPPINSFNINPTSASPIRFIRRSRLVEAVFPSVSHFLEFITSFPLLEDLEFGTINPPVGGSGLLTMGTKTDIPPLRLKTLKVGLFSDHPETDIMLIEALANSFDRTSIHTLDIVSMENVLSLQRLLQILGPSLKHLVIQPFFIPETAVGTIFSSIGTPILRNDIMANFPVDEFQSFSLLDCTALRTLDLSLYLRCIPMSGTWLPQALSQLTSPHLEEVDLTICYTSITELEDVDFERIDSIMTHQIPTGFQAFKLTLLPRSQQLLGEGGKLETSVRKKLRELEKRNLLKIRSQAFVNHEGDYIHSTVT